MSWSFEWVRSWQEIERPRFQEAWEEVLAADSGPCAFQRPDFLALWAATRGRELRAEPHFALASHPLGGRVILPLVVVERGGRFLARRVLEPAAGELTGYHDPPAAGGPIDWSTLWDAVRSELAPVHDQALVRLLHPEVAAPPAFVQPSEASPVLELGERRSLDEVLVDCSANHRGDTRRRLRRLRERGELELWCATPADAAQAEQEVRQRFLPAYAEIWRGHPDGSLADRPGVEELLLGLAREGVAGGWAHFAALRLDGEPIAWHLGLLHRGELYWWFPTYDPAHASLSPGKALLALLVAHAGQVGWRRIHLLSGAHGYKAAWKPEPLALRALAWHSPSWRGRALRAYDRWHSREAH